MEILNSFLTDTINLLKDWPSGTFVGIMMILLAIAVAVGICWLIYRAADSWGLPFLESLGTIQDHKHTSSSTNVVVPNKVPIIIHSPEEFHVAVLLDQTGQRILVKVPKKFYKTYKNGHRAKVIYVKGRFSGVLYPKMIEALKS